MADDTNNNGNNGDNGNGDNGDTNNPTEDAGEYGATRGLYDASVPVEPGEPKKLFENLPPAKYDGFDWTDGIPSPLSEFDIPGKPISQTDYFSMRSRAPSRSRQLRQSGGLRDNIPGLSDGGGIRE